MVIFVFSVAQSFCLYNSNGNFQTSKHQLNLMSSNLFLLHALTEQEIKVTKGFDETNEPSYYVRLGSLSTKLRQRAYQKAISKVQDGKKDSQESISKLNRAMDLVGHLQSLSLCFFPLSCNL